MNAGKTGASWINHPCFQQCAWLRLTNFTLDVLQLDLKDSSNITICKPLAIHIWLVVSTPLKNMKVNGKDDIPYAMENNPFMFETTNQSSYFNG